MIKFGRLLKSFIYHKANIQWNNFSNQKSDEQIFTHVKVQKVTFIVPFNYCVHNPDKSWITSQTARSIKIKKCI